MQYTSHLLVDYNAVFTHLDKLQTKYSKYGIVFDTEILVTDEGYKVSAVAKEAVV